MELVPKFPVEMQPIVAKALNLTNRMLKKQIFGFSTVAKLFCDNKEGQINYEVIHQCTLEDQQFDVHLLHEAQFLLISSGGYSWDMCIANRKDVYVNVTNMPQAIDEYSFKSSVLFVMVIFLHRILGHGCTYFLNSAANNANHSTGNDTTPEKVGRLCNGALVQHADYGFGFESIHFGGVLVCLHDNTIANTVARNIDLPMTEENLEFRMVGQQQADTLYDTLDLWDGEQMIDSSVFDAIRYENLADIDIDRRNSSSSWNQ